MLETLSKPCEVLNTTEHLFSQYTTEEKKNGLESLQWQRAFIQQSGVSFKKEFKFRKLQHCGLEKKFKGERAENQVFTD